MSRLYFSSPSGEAELAGPERHWLRHVACSIGEAAWDLNSISIVLDDWKFKLIMSWIPEHTGRFYGGMDDRDYLHVGYQKALAEAAQRLGQREEFHRFMESLRIRLGGVSAYDTIFKIAGHELNCANVVLNTAVAAGSPAVQAAAKMSGWDFTFVEGSNRAWFADVLEQGCNHGPFRRALRRFGGDEPEFDQDMGWDGVLEFLRSSDKEPVVTHHSTGDSFPSSYFSTWEHGPMPEGWHPPHWTEPSDLEEWAEMSSDAKLEYWDEQQSDLWYGLPAEERWAGSMEWLRTKQPWSELSPQKLGSVFFGYPVTVYDLLATDRDERVRAAFAKDSD